MRILFLDDDDERHALVRAALETQKASVRAVRTAQEAIAAVTSEKFDLILLDHDLGGQVFVESGPGTGFEVAQSIPRSINAATRVIVHSLNPDGAKNMIAAIGPAAQWVPFNLLRGYLSSLRRL